MAIDGAMAAAGPTRRATWTSDLGAAAIAALLALAIHAAGGFQTLANAHGDNDSLLRLVQIRDLIAGQGWFDLHQYRMGPEGGFVMHWSRLVDAPAAAITLAAATLTGSMARGETVALVAWPAMLFATGLFFLLRTSRRFAGEQAMLPALVIGGVAFHFLGIFAPGNIDHHNVQLVLTLAMVSLLVSARSAGPAFAAGACAALMLAVGMETAPYVAVAGALVAIRLLLVPATAPAATGFGLGFGGTGAAAFLATVPASTWFVAQCDAFSVPQFEVAAIGGTGLAAVASTPFLMRTAASRLGGLAVLGIVLAGALAALFPQCLGDPFTGMDPRLKTYWLNAVAEAQPLWRIIDTQPGLVPSYYATPLIGLCWMAIRFFRRRFDGIDATVAAFLGAAFLVSVWQVRGSMFAIPLAVIPLSAWIAEARARAAGGSDRMAAVKMALAWLLSFNVTWGAAGSGAAKLLGAPTNDAVTASVAQSTCQQAPDYAALAAMPAGTLLAVSNLGSPILAYTGHRALAGPYHRNVEGNLLTLSAFMGSPEEAERIARQNKVALVAICPGNDETGVMAGWAPDGFLARLIAGTVPAWLEPVPETMRAGLTLYRVAAKQ